MTHRETGYMQAALTLVYLVGYFFVLSTFLHGKVDTPEAWADTVKALISVLTAGVLTIIGYWFNRQRTSTDPPQETP